MACFNDCAKLQPASNMDLAAPLLVLWVPSPSAFSHPKRLAALPSLSVKLSPVSAGPGCSPVRTRRRAFSQNILGRTAVERVSQTTHSGT